MVCQKRSAFRIIPEILQCAQSEGHDTSVINQVTDAASKQCKGLVRFKSNLRLNPIEVNSALNVASATSRRNNLEVKETR